MLPTSICSHQRFHIVPHLPLCRMQNWWKTRRRRQKPHFRKNALFVCKTFIHIIIRMFKKFKTSFSVATMMRTTTYSLYRLVRLHFRSIVDSFHNAAFCRLALKHLRLWIPNKEWLKITLNKYWSNARYSWTILTISCWVSLWFSK